MFIEFTVSDVLPATPDAVYEAWMSSDGHAAMTGAPARVDPAVGGEFEAWDGYISGRTLALEPGRRIVQSWRTTDFAGGDADSAIDILLEEVEAGTRVTLRHTGIPDGQPDYAQGWRDFYFDPMHEHFGASS